LPLTLASTLLGSWDGTYGGGADCSSYLGLCSATEGLTQAFRAFHESYAETGLWGVLCVAERMKLEDLVFHLTYEWKRFSQELTDNELKRAKNQLLTDIARDDDLPERVADVMGAQVLALGRRVPFDEWKARVLAVDARRVRDVCTEYVWDRCPTVSAIGPIEQLEDYEVLRGKLYWMRY